MVISDMFKIKNGMLSSESSEAIAAASLNPETAIPLYQLPDILEVLIESACNEESPLECRYGALVAMANLTALPYPDNSETEQIIQKVKGLTPRKEHGNEETDNMKIILSEAAMETRKEMLDEKYIQRISQMMPTYTFASAAQAAKIILNFSEMPKVRGQLAQSGAVKGLISVATRAMNEKNPNNDENLKMAFCYSVLALARILISLDPALVFSPGRIHYSTAVKPMIRFLCDRNLNPTGDLADRVEIFMALTNLALTDELTCKIIVDEGYDEIELAMNSGNTILRRAATELICNLVRSEAGMRLYSSNSTQAKRRMQLLCAMDTDDLRTQLAVGGALATLTSESQSFHSIGSTNMFSDSILLMIESENLGLQLRGLTSILNIAINRLSTDADAAKTARAIMQRISGEEMLSRLHFLLQNGDAQVCSLVTEIVSTMKKK